MDSREIKFLVLLIGMVCLPGCNWPLLQKLPYFSSFSTVEREKKAPVPVVPQKPVAPKPAVSPAAAPVLPASIPTVPSSPKVNAAPPAAPDDVRQPPVSAPRNASPLPAPVAPRNRHLAETNPDLSYDNVVLTEDTVWRGQVSVKVGVTVAPQATLTVEPGTTVRFKEKGMLLVQGRVAAIGVPDRPIIFTSEFMEPEPGDWQGVLLLGSEKNNQFEHCTVEGADIGLGAAFSRLTVKNCLVNSCRTGAAFDDSLVSIRNGGFRKSGIAIQTRESELEVREVDVSANRQGIVAAASSVLVERGTFFGNEVEALVMENSRVGIRGNSLTGNGSGAVFIGTQGVVAANRIVNNTGVGVSAEGSRLRMNANDISGNGGIGLRVAEGRVVAWGNIIADNGEFEAYNTGKGEVTAVGNWWGERDEAAIAARIHGRHRDSVAGVVRFLPMLRVRPPIGP